jgi:hypothetical protein
MTKSLPATIEPCDYLASSSMNALKDRRGPWKPGGRTAPMTSSEFALRVKACRQLEGLEVETRWLDRGSVHFFVRHPYGAWAGIVVFNLKDGVCESETGSKMFHADVARRLQQLVLDKNERAWGKTKARARARERLDEVLTSPPQETVDVK